MAYIWNLYIKWLILNLELALNRELTQKKRLGLFCARAGQFGVQKDTRSASAKDISTNSLAIF